MGSTIGWLLLLLVGGGATVYLLAPKSSNGPGCPTAGDKAFAATIADIRSGKTDAATATAIFTSYQGLGCKEAAAAVHAAMVAAGATPPQVYKTPHGAAGPGGLGILSTLDPYTLEHLSLADAEGSLRMTVGDYLTKTMDEWSVWDRTVAAPHLAERILADFAAQGRYTPGKTPLARVTVYNQLLSQLNAANLSAGDMAPGTVDFGSDDTSAYGGHA